MQNYFADFHIHVGSALGKPVKMAASHNLTVESVLHHAREKKGLDIITLIDAVCTNVLAELTDLYRAGRLELALGGGYRFENGLTVILGAEVEVAGPIEGAAHFGCWFPTLDSASDFHDWLATVQKNPSLSSQKARASAIKLQQETKQRGGLFVIHHAFTPHKGIYGNCVASLSDMVDVSLVDGLELGLSADTAMADCINEVKRLTFLSNSDAHSVSKIAREYNALELTEASFVETSLALFRQAGRRVSGNFGLHPALGKYHKSRCAVCKAPWLAETKVCTCGSRRLVKGVSNRLAEIKSREVAGHPPHRPPYHYQIPLEFVPGLGKRNLQRLLEHFGTEMAILHHATLKDLAGVVGDDLALAVDRARRGQVEFAEGGGGVYGKVLL